MKEGIIMANITYVDGTIVIRGKVSDIAKYLYLTQKYLSEKVCNYFTNLDNYIFEDSKLSGLTDYELLSYIKGQVEDYITDGSFSMPFVGIGRNGYETNIEQQIRWLHGSVLNNAEDLKILNEVVAANLAIDYYYEEIDDEDLTSFENEVSLKNFSLE